MGKAYEIRDPIHGFIVLNDWERDIINHTVFQRLRRIRQLGMTDMVYPGAMHTRFEHSLGVMHVATKMFEGILSRRRGFLESELGYNDAGLDKDKALIRLAGLLHDVGHAPFSHAAEGLMVSDPKTGKALKHESYSAAAVEHLMRDVIENHPSNQNYGIKAADVAAFLDGRPSAGRSLIWRTLVSGQMDADRADYLLRDSHHIGVEYGRYDLNRLLVTLTVAIDPDTQSPKVAVEDGGVHAAEGLIVARYMMFTQVYFQRARRAFDRHLGCAMQTLLAESQRRSSLVRKDAFPPPTSLQRLKQYLEWNDWRVLGMIDSGRGGEHGRILRNREHYRSVFETPEVPAVTDLERVERVRKALGTKVGFVDKAENSWYKFEAADVPVLRRPGERGEHLLGLSQMSSVVSGLKSVNQTRVYVPYEKRDEAMSVVDGLSRRRVKR